MNAKLDDTQQLTGAEMLEAIRIMLLNRIDELQEEMERNCDGDIAAPYLRALTRREEAKYIFATCLDAKNFVARKLRS